MATCLFFTSSTCPISATMYDDSNIASVPQANRSAAEAMHDPCPFSFRKIANGHYVVSDINVEKIPIVYNHETLEKKRAAVFPGTYNGEFVDGVDEDAFNGINTFNNDPEKNQGLEARLYYTCRPEIYDNTTETCDDTFKADDDCVEVPGNNKLGYSNKRRPLPIFIHSARQVKECLLAGSPWSEVNFLPQPKEKEDMQEGEKNEEDTQEYQET